MNSEENDEVLNTRPETTKEAKITTNNLMPKTSKQYNSVYLTFMDWMKSKEITSFSESVLLTYFTEISKAIKPSTLWSRYSMLKYTLNVEKNINIGTYYKLAAFVKKNSKGFKSKKSSVLTVKHIKKFLAEAPDNQYLAVKVALIFGIVGACRRVELTNVTINDIKDYGELMLIKIRHIKKPRTFTIDGKFYEIVKKYTALRPKHVVTNRFFLSLKNGKCTVQPIGINKFGGMPRQIAEYLKLSNANSYTGHSFRRSSTTLLAITGEDITTIKRRSRWNRATVAKADETEDSSLWRAPTAENENATTTVENENATSMDDFVYVDINQQSSPYNSQVIDYWEKRPVNMGQDPIEFTMQTDETHQPQRNVNFRNARPNETGPPPLAPCRNVNVISKNATAPAIDFPAQLKTNDTSNAELTFFQSLIPDIMKLSGKRRRQFKEAVMSTLNKFLDEEESACATKT